MLQRERELLSEIFEGILEGQEIIMAAIDDLNTAVANLTAAVNQAIADQAGAVPAADVEAAATAVAAQTAALTAAFPAKV